MTNKNTLPFVQHAGYIHTLLDWQADKGHLHGKLCGGSELVFVFPI
jgi:hypothetical protein